ncbi:hypothetical protein PHSC3_001044 [Chlamydiales bacterium STE3]|nr:hypothetical protein PHSC3_001044 [Chlamydiales bacterium STE3]
MTASYLLFETVLKSRLTQNSDRLKHIVSCRFFYLIVFIVKMLCYISFGVIGNFVPFHRIKQEIMVGWIIGFESIATTKGVEVLLCAI